MDNKTKMGIGALLLASSVGVGVGRLTAAPPRPEVRLVGMSIDPVVALSVEVSGKMRRIQCTDVNGSVTKLNGKGFPDAKELCTAAEQFSAKAKASVGLLSNSIAQASESAK